MCVLVFHQLFQLVRARNRLLTTPYHTSYTQEKSREQYDEQASGEWEIGRGKIKAEVIIIVSLHNVFGSSWQALLRLRQPLYDGVS